MTTKDKQLLHDLIDDLDQAIHTKSNKEIEEFKREIQIVIQKLK